MRKKDSGKTGSGESSRNPGMRGSEAPSPAFRRYCSNANCQPYLGITRVIGDESETRGPSVRHSRINASSIIDR